MNAECPITVQPRVARISGTQITAYTLLGLVLACNISYLSFIAFKVFFRPWWTHRNHVNETLSNSESNSSAGDDDNDDVDVESQSRSTSVRSESMKNYQMGR